MATYRKGSVAGRNAMLELEKIVFDSKLESELRHEAARQSLELAKKLKTPLTPRIKRSMCRVCKRVLIVEDLAIFRIKSSQVIRSCSICGKKRRISS